jgi:hypothetical protein
LSRSPLAHTAIIVGWLLTPVVAWAASLLGGWIGALIAPRVSQGFSPLAWLFAGLFLGGLGGVLAWVWLMRLLNRRTMATRASGEEPVL